MDTSWSLNLKKSLKKIIQLKKENEGKAQKKRKAGQEETNFALISELLSDGEIPVKKVNVVKSSIFKRDTSFLANLIDLIIKLMSTFHLSALQTVNHAGKSWSLSNTEQYKFIF